VEYKRLPLLVIGDMGCRQTKVDHDPNVGNGKLGNGIPSKGPQALAPVGPASGPQEDPRLPLTNREIFRLNSSWKAIRRTLEETGIEMFIR
jgi:hypothetical protein